MDDSLFLNMMSNIEVRLDIMYGNCNLDQFVKLHDMLLTEAAFLEEHYLKGELSRGYNV